MKIIHKIYLISLIIIAVPSILLWRGAKKEVEQNPYALSKENPAYVETIIGVDLPNIAKTTSEYKNQRWLAHNSTFEQPLSEECINQLEQLCKENDKWSKECRGGEICYRYYHSFSYPGREYELNIIECVIYNTGYRFSYQPDFEELTGVGAGLILFPVLVLIFAIVWTIILYATAGVVYLIRERRNKDC